MVMALTDITSFAPSLLAPSLSHPTTPSVIDSPSAFVRATFSGLKYQHPFRLRPVFSAPSPFAGTTNLEDNNDEESKKFERRNLNVHFNVVRNLPPVFKDRAKNILKDAEAIMESDAINQTDFGYIARDYGNIAEQMVVLFQDISYYVGDRRKEEKNMDFCMHPLGIFTVFLCCILCFLGSLAGSFMRILRLLGCCCCIRWLMSSVSKILSDWREEEEEDQ